MQNEKNRTRAVTDVIIILVLTIITESARPGRMQQARKVLLPAWQMPKRVLIRTKVTRCSTGTASRFIRRQHSSRTRCALKLPI